MPKPKMGPCGGPNQPPCPPEPATKTESGLRQEPPKGDDGPIKDYHEGAK